ncbi:MAG: hypothetical protein IE927_10550 [Rhodobacterales bacterium]|nr:hypothetical protein [Rhodobacterales bacterium]
MPADLGLAGAQLGLADNLTTGGFLGHAYALIPIDVPPGGDFAAAARQALGPRGWSWWMPRRRRC